MEYEQERSREGSRKVGNLSVWILNVRIDSDDRGCILTRSGCTLTHKGCILTHRGCIQTHRGSILTHMGCILAHRCYILAHRGCILKGAPATQACLGRPCFRWGSSCAQVVRRLCAGSVKQAAAF